MPRCCLIPGGPALLAELKRGYAQGVKDSLGDWYAEQCGYGYEESVEELQKMATLTAFIKGSRQLAQYPMEDDIDDQCARESHERSAEAFQQFQQEFLDQAGY